MGDEICGSYEGFAYVYDTFMDDVPYEQWAEYVTGLLQEYGIEEGLVLDLGCGTGSMTELLSEKGYDMIGVDLSADMLEIAMEKRERSGSEILYLQQDMREFELYGTVGAVVSVCDSINYILEGEELRKVFSLVNNYLDPGGIFLFDLNTVYKYRELLGDSVIAENREECSFIWENTFYEEERINEYDLTIFRKEDGDLYRKYEETHFQRAYEIEEIKEFLLEAGLELIAVYDAFTRLEPQETSERVYFIAREWKKKEAIQKTMSEMRETEEK
jgi:SAM-dependent methyltransferase